MEFLDKYFRDLIATLILLICLFTTIFKKKKSKKLHKTLNLIIVGCLGYILRGSC